MPISRDEAAAALQDIARTSGRSQTFRGYRIAGPILILWGVIWVAGYSAMGVLPPPQWGWLWLGLDTVGVGGSIALAVRGTRAAGMRPRGLNAWRPFLWGLSISARPSR